MRLRTTYFLLLSAALLLGLVNSASAMAPGFYGGIMTGPASNTGGSQQAQVSGSITTTATVKPKSKQWGTRLYMGYKMNAYASWELGGTYYSTIHYNTQGVAICGNLSSQVRGIDLVGRGGLPLKYFEVFGKGGVSYAFTKTPGAFYTATGGANCGNNNNTFKFRPTLAVGVSYDLSQSWQVDVSWTRLINGNPIGNVDLYALGFSYHIVDRYCGQFLCDD